VSPGPDGQLTHPRKPPRSRRVIVARAHRPPSVPGAFHLSSRSTSLRWRLHHERQPRRVATPWRSLSRVRSSQCGVGTPLPCQTSSCAIIHREALPMTPTGIRNADQLERTLDRAVLAIAAVQHNEDSVEPVFDERFESPLLRIESVCIDVFFFRAANTMEPLLSETAPRGNARPSSRRPCRSRGVHASPRYAPRDRSTRSAAYGRRRAHHASMPRVPFPRVTINLRASRCERPDFMP